MEPDKNKNQNQKQKNRFNAWPARKLYFYLHFCVDYIFKMCLSPFLFPYVIQHPVNLHIDFSLSFFGAQLASFRPSSQINYEWMQTLAGEYGLQEARDKLSPLGRTFNLLSRGTAPFQVAQLKDMHLPAFYSPAARRFKRRQSIWSKWHYTDSRCGLFCTNVCSVQWIRRLYSRTDLINLKCVAKEKRKFHWCSGRISCVITPGKIWLALKMFSQFVEILHKRKYLWYKLFHFRVWLYLFERSKSFKALFYLLDNQYKTITLTIHFFVFYHLLCLAFEWVHNLIKTIKIFHFTALLCHIPQFTP